MKIPLNFSQEIESEEFIEKLNQASGFEWIPVKAVKGLNKKVDKAIEEWVKARQE